MYSRDRLVLVVRQGWVVGLLGVGLGVLVGLALGSHFGGHSVPRLQTVTVVSSVTATPTAVPLPVGVTPVPTEAPLPSAQQMVQVTVRCVNAKPVPSLGYCQFTAGLLYPHDPSPLFMVLAGCISGHGNCTYQPMCVQSSMIPLYLRYQQQVTFTCQGYAPHGPVAGGQPMGTCVGDGESLSRCSRAQDFVPDQQVVLVRWIVEG
jgi:hypothetical protein